MASQEQDAKADVSIPAWRANLVAGALVPFVAVIMLLVYSKLHGGAAFSKDAAILFRLDVLIPVGAVSVVLHEALHAAGFVRFGRLPWRAIRFGLYWKALAPYAHAQGAMLASAYRKAIIFPGLVLGVVPAACGLALGAGWLYAYGMLMVAAAGGDFIVLWIIRGVAASERVEDHSERPGCWVLADEPLR